MNNNNSIKGAEEAPPLKNFMVVQDHEGTFHVWTKERYEIYIRGCVRVGGGSAYKIITVFDGNEDYLMQSPTTGKGVQSAEDKLLSEITLEDAIEVLKLGEGWYTGYDYKIRYVKNEGDRLPFAQLYYPYGKTEVICANFDDGLHSPVKLCKGNEYFRCHARIYIYLVSQGYKFPYPEITLPFTTVPEDVEKFRDEEAAKEFSEDRKRSELLTADYNQKQRAKQKIFKVGFDLCYKTFCQPAGEKIKVYVPIEIKEGCELPKEIHCHFVLRNNHTKDKADWNSLIYFV